MTVVAARRVDGVLLLDKPVGITSNAAIQQVKRLFRAGKAGHVGTLDPLASGLLPVCMGEATKFSTGAFGADKRYAAEIMLGVTTTTGDREGNVTSRHGVCVTLEQIAAALQQFTGAIAQTPPMYSALKRDGKPLYAYARAGLSLTLEPRRVVIHAMTLRAHSGDRLHVDVHCSKGTYIRVLAEDIGRALGCGATLAGLRRVAVAELDVAHACTVEQLEVASEQERLAWLMPVDSLVSSLPKMCVDAGQALRLLAGQPVQTGLESAESIRIYDREYRFLGLGEVRAGGVLVPKRLLAARRADNMADKSLQAPKIA
jgi:tRNA pseudouridine55 synthase